ncbi:MAG: hypothetical protein QRY16_03140, partial [Enterobacterales bacterium endosymbiont of Blomia tropicalis]|uniref:hypothetical protein n=1 Tax=Mixta mediterraneensis TaxID=2758443 RepID=UPI0025A7251E
SLLPLRATDKGCRAATLDPRFRPARPPLRGAFASSRFLYGPDGFAVLAHAVLFAASLPLVLKSLIRSADGMASGNPPLQQRLFPFMNLSR